MGDGRNSRSERVVEDYDCLRFTWIDIHGMPKGKTVPRRNIASFWREGMHASAASLAMGPQGKDVALPCQEQQGYGNMLARVIPKTLHHLPWAGAPQFKVGEVLCECLEVNEGLTRPHGVCTRSIARQLIEQLQEEFGLRMYSAYESEFQLLNKATLQPVFANRETLNHLRLSEHESFLFEMQEKLYEAGVDTECFHIEDSPGQFELSTVPSFGIQALDQSIWLKNGIKEYSLKKGFLATFMGKPYLEGIANAGQFNHSLWDADGQNVLFNPERPSNMSSTFRHWLAGLIKHAPALTILCSPTINCYRCLHREFMPHCSDWGIDNRLTSYRVKSTSPMATYVENRLGTAAANPYLMAAGTLAAGMDGLRSQLELVPSGPRKDAAVLPRTLAEAAEALEANKVMREALGERFVDWFLREKRQCEIECFPDVDVYKNEPEMLVKEREIYLRVI